MYSIHPIKHNILNIDLYTHFTSPIRRYIDIIIHRLLVDKNTYSKRELIKYIEDIQQELIKKPLSIFDICPDVVDTEMTEGMWEHWPKLEARSVAEAVWYCFDSQPKFNINKLVLQKNAI